MSDWNPDDPLLKAIRAPHETAAVMRWHRAKVPSQEIMKLLGYRGTRLIKSLETAAEQEQAAHERGLEIHDALIYEEES